MTTALYEIETSEADDGTTHPAEALCTPAGRNAVHHGFALHGGVYVVGISSPADDNLLPAVPHPGGQVRALVRVGRKEAALRP
ncbi:hypothetical protein ACH4F6_31055 [Streptomyces sp. NPDC017936]|uniref:hypothetical protein n=1 Tax=Streptomyces sp. NPDC017936 TaxID=3365016 RepID=UPI0037A1A9D9